MRPASAIGVAWIGWVVSWFAASFWTNRTVKRVALRDEFVPRVLIPIGAILIAVGADYDTTLTGAAGWTAFGMLIAGLAFAWWGRLYIGRLWSARITRAEGHRVVMTGPYALVRHPIYAGVIVAIIATALVQWRWQAIIGAVLIAVSFWLRARLEERFLREELGREAYDVYSRRVPMLIPFWPRTG
jgi:protein-S-isoprenylcysteine O-methyltransferase Ste14